MFSICKRGGYLTSLFLYVRSEDMKKIICIILVSIIGISIIPKTLINEKHIVLESTTSVYTKEEVDILLSTIRTNITNNTNEITNIKNELTTLKNSLSNYTLKTSLNTTNSNIDNLNSIVTDNTSRIEYLETSLTPTKKTFGLRVSNSNSAIINMKKNTDTLTIEPYTNYTGSCSFEIHSVDSDNYIAFHDNTNGVIETVTISATSTPVNVDINQYERIVIRTVYNTNTSCSGTVLISN